MLIGRHRSRSRHGTVIARLLAQAVQQAARLSGFSIEQRLGPRRRLLLAREREQLRRGAPPAHRREFCSRSRLLHNPIRNLVCQLVVGSPIKICQSVTQNWNSAFQSGCRCMPFRPTITAAVDSSRVYATTSLHRGSVLEVRGTALLEVCRLAAE